MSNTNLSEKDLVLATDLDGTFLGGCRSKRNQLFNWIEANRDSVGLIFVTGRDPEFIRALCASGVPWPDYAICDVGTTIASVSPELGVQPISHLEEEIATVWGQAGSTVFDALDGHPGLSLQSTAFRYRLSYDMDPNTFDPSAKSKVEAIGQDWLISGERFFDVLPKGVSKGPSLRRLISYLQIADDRVLAAGDTLNDLSMLASGLPAVAVGQSERALFTALADYPSVHRAGAPGVEGIVEAIFALRMHPLAIDPNG